MRQNNSKIIAAMLFCIVSFSSISASAHGGGLNSKGCHNDRKRGSYHCHRSGYSPLTALQSKVYSVPRNNLKAFSNSGLTTNAIPSANIFSSTTKSYDNASVRKAINDLENFLLLELGPTHLNYFSHYFHDKCPEFEESKDELSQEIKLAEFYVRRVKDPEIKQAWETFYEQTNRLALLSYHDLSKLRRNKYEQDKVIESIHNSRILLMSLLENK